jgi:hypothetical protein
VISLYKFGKTANGTEKEEPIKEALAILASLDADGKLNEGKKDWKSSFLSLRGDPEL